MSSFVGFFNSTFISSLVASLVTVFSAYLLFRHQLGTQKRSAAIIILQEIESAQSLLSDIEKRLNESKGLRTDVRLMPNDSWGTFRHMFVRDLNQTEWNLISQFYDRCAIINRAIVHQSSLFEKNEDGIRNYFQSIAFNEMQSTDFNEKATKFDSVNEKQQFVLKHGTTMSYNPDKPILDAKLFLSEVPNNILVSSAGVRLRRIARLK